MPAPSDEVLMAAVAGGDLDAFGQLVARHQRSAWNAAYRFLGNAADAEDVAQEAFLRVLDAAGAPFAATGWLAMGFGHTR